MEGCFCWYSKSISLSQKSIKFILSVIKWGKGEDFNIRPLISAFAFAPESFKHLTGIKLNNYYTNIILFWTDT